MHGTQHLDDQYLTDFFLKNWASILESSKKGVNFISGRIRRHHDLKGLESISMWQRILHLNYTQDPCYYPVTKSLLEKVKLLFLPTDDFSKREAKL